MSIVGGAVRVVNTESSPVPVAIISGGGSGSGSGGTEYTEDAVAPANPVGTFIVARRRDTPASEVSDDGDVVAINATADGSLRIAGTVTSVTSGPAADNAAVSGNPVLGGATYSTSGTITTYQAGDVANLQCDSAGSLRSLMVGRSGSPVATGTSVILPLSTLSNSTTGNPLGTLSYGWNGTNTVPTPGDSNGLVVQPALPASFFSYASAAGGIVNSTTAVTIKAAAGAGLRNYLTALQIDWDDLGSASELAVRDGSAGTVLWRMKIPAGIPGLREVAFNPPLRGSANTLLEVVTLTAGGAGKAVFVNAQGYTGA